VHDLPARSHSLLVPHAVNKIKAFAISFAAMMCEGQKAAGNLTNQIIDSAVNGGVSRLWPLQTVESGGKWIGWVMEVFRALALQSRP
jgi:hypothetical protein